MANSFYEHSGYPPGSRARNSSQKLRAEFSAIEAGAQAIETALALKADAADVSEVDNTSDADKPISTLTQAALDLKADYSALVDFDPATAGADRMLVTNATGDGWEYPSITAAGKALLDDASAAAQRATLGLGNVANVDTTNASNISSGTLAVARLADYSRKNLLINGGFDVWQRGTSFNVGNSYKYTADRWYAYCPRMGAGTIFERGSFAIGQDDVPSNPTHYLRCTMDAGASPTAGILQYRINNVALLSGREVTLSFYAKADDAKYIAVNSIQHFGSGGSSNTAVYTYAEKTILTTSWVRKSFTFTMPSVSGKTIGTGDTYTAIYIFMSYDGAPASGLPSGYEMVDQEGVFDFANVQLEFGDTATDFEYRHLAEELALCKQFYRTGTLRGPFSQYAVTPRAFVAGPLVSFNMRRTPDITLGPLVPLGHDGAPGTLYGDSAAPWGFNPVYNWTGGTIGRSFFGQAPWAADAEIY